MGKLERDIVQAAEIHLVDQLNGRRGNPGLPLEFVECNSALKQHIAASFPKLKKAFHVGNTYGSSIGDVRLGLTDGTSVALELKYVQAGSSGTRANIGQDSLTQYGLFKKRKEKLPVSWSHFRESKGHRAKVISILKRCFNKPITSDKDIQRCADDLKKKLNVGKRGARGVAQDVLASGPKSLASTARAIVDIVEYDGDLKREYIQYLLRYPFDQNAAFRFVALILSGSHTGASFLAFDTAPRAKILGLLKKEQYYVYYAYKGTGEVARERLDRLLMKIGKAKLRIRGELAQTNMMIETKTSHGWRDVLRVVFHWKNKFQGIQTPCLNIFDGKIVTEFVDELNSRGK